MHLVQDCASPAHVRNDAHPLNDSFEKWTNYNTEISLIVFPTVDTSVAPYGFDPISQFFDTDQYNGSNPSVYTAQGLAEYTNANFASDDTIFTETLNPSENHFNPLPRRADTQEYAEEVGSGYIRIYFRKIQNGEVIEHFAADPDGEYPIFNQVVVSVNRFFDAYMIGDCQWYQIFFSKSNFEVEDWERHEFQMVDTPADII